MSAQAAKTNSREEIIDYIRSQKTRLMRSFHIRKIALIGSFARSEQDADSDVDLLVDIEEGTPNIYQVKRTLKMEFERQFQRPVEIASERYLKPYYRDRILRDAIYV